MFGASIVSDERLGFPPIFLPGACDRLLFRVLVFQGEGTRACIAMHVTQLTLSRRQKRGNGLCFGREGKR